MEKRCRTVHRKTRFLWCIFLVIRGVFLFADSYDEVAGSGLFINSDPSGAKVFIDGVERGTTPLSMESIRIGEYNIRITKEGYVDRRFIVKVHRNSRVEISVDLEESKGQILLEIQRDPYAPPSLIMNPLITADGSRVSEMNLTLPVGWRIITVEAFGWERDSRNIYIAEGSNQKLEFILKPAAFQLSNASLRKKRFNPKNPGALGTAEINFSVSAPGSGIMEVMDEGGTIVYSVPLGPFTTWQQRISWNGHGRNGIVEEGAYTIRISAWSEETSWNRKTEELAVRVDSSMEIRPLTLASSSPGLLFVPSPEALPASSFQIEGSMIAGKALAQGAWETLPFAAAFRVSILDNLEMAAAFNAAPEFSGGTGWGGGASVKWVFLRSPRNSTGRFMDAFGAAAELSYGWAKTGPYTAFGMGTGLGIRLPLAYRILPGTLSLDLLLSPLVLWAGEKGYPDSAAPRLGMEGGLMLSYKRLAGGISVHWDGAPPGTKNPGPGPLMSALEIKFFPSNLIFSLSGGAWYQERIAGVFFGAGIGVVY
jgi:hypothetical protein